MEENGVEELLGQDAKASAKVEDGIEITGFAFTEDDVGNGRIRETAFESESVSRPVTFVEKLDDAGRNSRDGIHRIFTPL